MTLLGGAKVTVMLDDINGYKGLFAATIKQSIVDAMLTCDKENKKINSLAKDGLEFLFGEDIELYLHFLDIDKDYFQKHLVQEMFDKHSTNPAITEIKKRQFRINYRKWVQEKNERLVFMATYKVKRK